MDKSVLEVTRYLPRSSLQEMSAIKIMTTLCNDAQLLRRILSCNFYEDVDYRLCNRNEREWKAVLKMAKELVSQICNSSIIKINILEYLWPVSYRILVWKNVYAPIIENRFLQYFYWTDRGRIDNAKTARRIIGNQNIPIELRFFLGCVVSLGDELLQIWNEMSHADKLYFLAGNGEESHPLLLFWARRLDGSQDYLDESVTRALEFAVTTGLLDSVKFIFAMYRSNIRQGIERPLMEIILMNLVRKRHLEEDENDIAYLLFFEMTEEDQEEYFNTKTVFMLSLLLNSAEYELSLILLKTRLDSTSKAGSILIYAVMVYKFLLEVPNHEDFAKLLVNVWRVVSTSVEFSEFKSEFSTEIIATLIRDNFPFILEENASTKIAKLTSDFSILSAKPFYFNQGKWYVLNFLIKEENVIPLFKASKDAFISLMKKRRSNTAAWLRLLCFVRNIKKKNSKQK